MTFPTALDTFVAPSPSDALGATGDELDLVIAKIQVAVAALEVKVGIDSSAVTTTLDYKTAQFYKGTGSPEGVKSAAVGSVFQRTDGGASTSLYVKESGSGNTGWVAYGASGAAAFVGASVYRSSAQSITSGAVTAISFDTDATDSAALWVIGSPTRITVPNTKRYQVNGCAQLNGPTSLTRLFGEIYVNGSATGWRSEPPANSTAGFPGFAVSALLNLTAADYVELCIFQTSSGSVNTVATTSRLSVHQIG